jgi:hypothetical protein
VKRPTQDDEQELADDGGAKRPLIAELRALRRALVDLTRCLPQPPARPEDFDDVRKGS